MVDLLAMESTISSELPYFDMKSRHGDITRLGPLLRILNSGVTRFLRRLFTDNDEKLYKPPGFPNLSRIQWL